MKASQTHKEPDTTESTWTILKLIRWTTSYFSSHDIDSPRSTAEILLAHSLKIQKIDLYLQFDQPLSSRELSDYKLLIKRRIRREPVAYITGEKEFWSMNFSVSKDVLIPRPDTECLVESTLGIISSTKNNNFPEDLPSDNNSTPKRILELGTGSGAVIISIAFEVFLSVDDKSFFFASDRCPKAVKTAQHNAKRNHLNSHINFLCGSWFSPFNLKKHLFDIIISNPPYIPTDTVNTLQPEISEFEPRLALNGGEDGLDSIRHIVGSAHLLLKDKGHLILEIGYDQKEYIQEIIEDSGYYENIIFKKDYAGHIRVVQMVKK